jgi:predicted ATPase
MGGTEEDDLDANAEIDGLDPDVERIASNLTDHDAGAEGFACDLDALDPDVERIAGDLEKLDPDVERIAGDLTDLEDVAWERESRNAPHLVQTLDNLRAIGDIFAAFRDSRPIDPAKMDTEAPGSETAPSSLLSGAGGTARSNRSMLGPLPVPPFRWGHLEVREQIARGGFGSVYRAFDPALDREVALKLLPTIAGGHPPGLLEARRLARIRHPNVLAVHGVEQHGGFIGIETDLIAGASLAEELKRRGPLSTRESCLIGVDLCRALSAVHAAGLVHGDLKAANVMCEPGGSAMLVDFGSVRNLRNPAEDGSLSGTPLSLAPEVLLGRPPGPAADLYSLGELLHLAVTGSHAVEATSLDELRAHHEAGRPRPAVADRFPDVPRRLARILDRALAPLEQRYTQAREMERDLSDLLLDQPDPPGGTRAVSHHNLPHRLSRFVGRETFTELTQRAVRAHRLVTLTGVPGCGKTRLAMESARRMLAEFSGMWMIDLAVLTDPAQIPHELARSCGARERPGASALESIEAHLREESALLVLDNCEHLLDAVGRIVQQLLESSPALQVLITSREALLVPGEQVIRVTPMEIPRPMSDSSGELRKVESIQLFLDRARNSTDLLDDPSALPVIARICRELDGLPLSIEIAAAMSETVPLEEIDRRVKSGMTLGAEQRGSVDRHRSLGHLIGWSYERMTPAEQKLFRSLSVFAGGWSLEAAEAIGSGPMMPAHEVLTLLARLTAMSLVERDGRARYRILPTILLYAKERASECGETGGLRRRHREHFRAFALDAASQLSGSEQGAFLSRLEADLDNLRAASLAYLEPDGDLERGLELISALGHFWRLRGHFAEGAELCRSFLHDSRVAEALDCDFARSSPASREAVANVLLVASDLAYRRGESAEARLLSSHALESGRVLRNPTLIATALLRLGNLEKQAGRVREARALYSESSVHRRKSGDRAALASILINLGIADSMLGDAENARRSFLESLDIYQGLRQPWGIASISNSLGVLALTNHELPEAERWLQEAFDLYRKIEDDSGTGNAALNLGILFTRKGEKARARLMLGEALACARRVEEPAIAMRAMLQIANYDLEAGELDRVEANLRECVALAARMEDVLVLFTALPGLATVAMRRGRIDEAFRLLSAAQRLRQDHPMGRESIAHAHAAEQELRARAGAAEFEARWAEAALLPIEEILRGFPQGSRPGRRNQPS